MSASKIYTISEFENILLELDGKGFHYYQGLLGSSVEYKMFSLSFLHIQGSVGAYPASVCQLRIKREYFSLPEWAVISRARETAAADYILRAFNEAINRYAKQNRGVDGSGSFQAQVLPQQILKRNIVKISPVSIFFRMSFPGTRSNKVLGRQAALMFLNEIPAIVKYLKKKIGDVEALKASCENVENALFIQSALEEKNLVAFVADGSVLPRASGESDKPGQKGVVPFKAPDDSAVFFNLPNGGKIRGLGIRSGVTVLIGGGFHGKSTLVNALAKAVYPHILGDGRERVVSNKCAVAISAEDGRSIQGLDISQFISTLPDGSDSTDFSTKNASGSTSEAAAIVESVCSGAQLLLIDEDSSATNFLIRDCYMRKLIPEDPITPLFDRVRQLYETYKVSTIIIAGGSSEYIGVADQVIAMRDYRPVSMTKESKALNLPQPIKNKSPLIIDDGRNILSDNFDAYYFNTRIKKGVSVRIKPLRKQENNFLEYGQDLLDLSQLSGLVDPDQLTTIGFALLMAKTRLLGKKRLSPATLAADIWEIIEKEGWEVLQPEKHPPLFFAHVRLLELAGAINRLRSLKVSLG